MFVVLVNDLRLPKLGAQDLAFFGHKHGGGESIIQRNLSGR